MEIHHISTTLLSNWPLCPARAMVSYDKRNEHGDDFEGTEPTRFGSVVHAVAERYHLAHMRGEGMPPIMEMFDEEWRKSYAYDYDYYSLGRDLIETFIERTIHQRRGDTVAVELDFVLDVVHNEIWVVEDSEERRAKVAEVLKNGGVPIASKIDRIDRVDEHTFEIFDYKTNSQQFTTWEVQNSKQLGVYDLAVRTLYPEAETVVCVFDMVRHGRFSTEFSKQHRENLRHYLINMWHQIAGLQGDPERRLNKYCTWCEIRNTCPAYQDALQTDPVVGTADDGDFSTLYDIYEEFSNRIKILDAERDRIKVLLSTAIVQENQGDPLALEDGREIYLSPNKRGEYQMREIYPILQKKKALVLLKDYGSIYKGSVDRLLKQRPDLRPEIEPLLRTTFNAPTLRARRKDQNVQGEDVPAGDI